ncbi:hypothetical protein lerEdw1_002874 [Lerista edwardsae]|nr:hypothetical protein lerEdw1_002874 [Lerista edwardsae]
MLPWRWQPWARLCCWSGPFVQFLALTVITFGVLAPFFGLLAPSFQVILGLKLAISSVLQKLGQKQQWAG